MSDFEDIEVGAPEVAESSSAESKTTPYLVSDIFTSDDQRQQFLAWVSAEIRDVRDGGERAERAKLWQTYRRIRRAKKAQSVRNTPWIRSSAIESTLAAQKVNALYAKEVAAFAVKKPPVRVTSARGDTTGKAKSLENFFKHVGENRYGMNMPVVQNALFYDQVSLGFAVAKVPFQIDQWSFKRKNADSGAEDVTYIRHRGPAVVPIRAEDFFTRPYWKDIQRAPWIATKWTLYGHELRQKVALQFFDEKAVDVLDVQSKLDEARESSLKDAALNAQSFGSADENAQYEIYEVNAFFDVDGDGFAEDVIAWIEPDKQILLRSEFNPLSIRDIEFIPYIDDPETLYAVGVCDLVADLQEEHTSLKRMRLDGTQLAMLKIFVSRTGCGISPNEEFSPFKHIQVDDPQQDLRTIDFPDISQSCIMAEELCKQEADRVTGANDYMTGFNDKTVGTSATVGGTMFLAQQGNSILNSILTRAEQSIGNIYMIALYQCMANAEQVDLSFLSDEDQTNMRDILAMRVEDIPTMFHFKVQTTDITQTNEAQKQNVLGAAQLYAMYGQQILQLMGQAATPELQAMMPEVATKLVIGATELLENALDKMAIPNPESMLPFTDHLKVQLDATDKVRGEQVRAMRGALSENEPGGSARPVGSGAGSPSGDIASGGAAAVATGGGGGILGM